MHLSEAEIVACHLAGIDPLLVELLDAEGHLSVLAEATLETVSGMSLGLAHPEEEFASYVARAVAHIETWGEDAEDEADKRSAVATASDALKVLSLGRVAYASLRSKMLMAAEHAIAAKLGHIAFASGPALERTGEAVAAAARDASRAWLKDALRD